MFHYVSRTTPLVNVDLLIKDEKGRTLLTWRSDKYCGKGWHIPGGIIRFKETFETRLRKVAETEVGAEVLFDPVPLAVRQCVNRDRAVRGHFISLLYRCGLPSSFVPANGDRSPATPGFIKWHDSCPADLLEVQEMYREYINGAAPGAGK